MPRGRINQLSEEEISYTFQKFGVGGQKRDYTMDGKNELRLIEVSKLKPHPRNEVIYGNESISDLVVQIRAYGGIADPLKIKQDYTIISGHRR